MFTNKIIVVTAFARRRFVVDYCNLTVALKLFIMTFAKIAEINLFSSYLT